jgi:hypothetical protein
MELVILNDKKVENHSFRKEKLQELKSTKKHHPNVKTQDWYYFYAANFSKSFLKYIPNWVIQVIRIVFGLLIS